MRPALARAIQDAKLLDPSPHRKAAVGVEGRKGILQKLDYRLAILHLISALAGKNNLLFLHILRQAVECVTNLPALPTHRKTDAVWKVGINLRRLCTGGVHQRDKLFKHRSVGDGDLLAAPVSIGDATDIGKRKGRWRFCFFVQRNDRRTAEDRPQHCKSKNKGKHLLEKSFLHFLSSYCFGVQILKNCFTSSLLFFPILPLCQNRLPSPVRFAGEELGGKTKRHKTF